MLTLIAIALMPLAGQTSELPGESETIYKITLPGGEERYGAVRETTGQQVTIVFDEPWAPSRPANFAQVSVKAEPEPKVARAERLEREGRKAGFVLHETTAGKRWVREEDLRFFNRAKEMLARPSPDVTSAPQPVAMAGDAEAPGMLAQWGSHAAVLLFGAALAGLVWKTLLADR